MPQADWKIRACSQAEASELISSLRAAYRILGSCKQRTIRDFLRQVDSAVMQRVTRKNAHPMNVCGGKAEPF